MKRILLPVALIAALCVPRLVEACGGMSAAQLAAFLARLERLDPTPTPPPAAAPAPAPDPTPVAQADPAPQADPTPATPVVTYVPPPPPPPPMVQLSPGAINGGLTTRSQTVESTNEQVTQDLHEGLIIS